MSTPARIVLILLGLIVLAVGAGIGFLLTLDPERYRGDLVRVIHDNTDLDVRLDGPIGWQLWPSIALSVEDAAADWSTAADADEPPLVSVRRIEFEAGLWPLLSTSPRLEIERVVLDGVAIDLRVDASGRDNWSPPAGDAADGDADGDADADAGTDDETQTEGSAQLDLARFEVLDLSIRYRDAVGGTDAALSGLDLIGTTRGPTLVDLRLSGRATVVDGPDVAFEGRLDLDLAGPRVEFVDVGADLTLPGARAAVPVRLRGLVSVDTEADRADVEGLELSVGNLRTTFDGRVDALSGDPSLALDARLAPSDLRALLERLDALPPTRDADALKHLAGNLSVAGTASDLRIEGLELELDALRLSGSASVRADAVGGRTAIGFALDAGRLDLRPYLAEAPEAAPAEDGGPLVTDDPIDLSAMNEFDVDGRITASALVLPQLSVGASLIEIDQRAGRLQARITAAELLGGSVELIANVNAAETTPRIGLNIAADALAAARVLPGAGFTGPLALNGRIDASGASTAALARAVRGQIRIDGDGGTLDVTELKTGLAGIAQLLGKGQRIAAWPDRLGYEALAGTWSLNSGLGDQALQLTIDNLRIDGSGGIELDSGDFDLRAGSIFTTSTPRTFDVPPELDGIRLPFRCGGNLAGEGNPCGFDQDATGELVTQIMRSKAGDQVRQRIEEQLPENLRGPATQLLRGLFGAPQQQQQPRQPQQTDPGATQPR